MKTLRKIYAKRWVLRSILPTIWFNFHYLPFRQAVRLPILLYKPKLLACKGRVMIQAEKLRTGMIVLGKYECSIYPNNGITFENKGTVIFGGDIYIGNNSFISVGKTGKVVLGDRLGATSSLKIVSYCEVVLEEKVRCGWETLVMDTDFHRLTMQDGSPSPKAYGKIRIGKGCWLGTKTMVMKNTVLPPYCVTAANSLLNKPYDCPEKSLLAGQPARLKKTGVYRDIDNDEVVYE